MRYATETTLGRNIARLRKSRGLTQTQLAYRSHRASVAMIEAGYRQSPRPETLRAIARVLKVDVSDLFREPKRRRRA